MAHYSCITAKQRDGETVVLFEGDKPLPFFWLMLLDAEDITRYQQQLSDIITRQQADSIDTHMVIDKLKALSLAANRRDYIKQYYKTCVPLFDDWIHFMQTADFSDMKIYIDLYPIRLSYATPEHFTESLLKAIACFDEKKEAWYEATVAGTCGREGHHNNRRRFSELSTAYQRLNQEDIYGRFEKKIHLNRKGRSNKKALLLLFTVIIVVFIGLLLFLMK